MPRDAVVMWKLFMVDKVHIRTGKVLLTKGPYSEGEAMTRKRELDNKDARCYIDIRRATPQEREQ